ncbi:MAG: adenosylmethionine decarboxylase [Leptospirillia bacterium]
MRHLPTATPTSPDHTYVPGLHVIADLVGCAAHAIMTDAEKLEQICLTYIRDAGLFDMGSQFFAFPGAGGVTGMVILAESHLSIHTWPEHNYVCLDIFVCNYSKDSSPKARQVAERLIALFNPSETRMHEVTR